ncbi:hypothetical protein BVRB_6g148350 [Beta vulgaris subsp. vulgaris]|nr:hypothetical protein BVRB_6g148350 [Beta vulgaris subsp. vulgaris]
MFFFSYLDKLLADQLELLQSKRLASYIIRGWSIRGGAQTEICSLLSSAVDSEEMCRGPLFLQLL